MSWHAKRRLLVALFVPWLVAVVACSRAREAPHDRPAEPAAARDGAASSVPTAGALTASHDLAPDTGLAPLRFVSAPDDVELGSYLRSERLRQRAEGRLLVVYAGASWCPPCKRFAAAAHNGQLSGVLGHVTVVELDADRDVERLASLGYVFKNIPYFAVPGEGGRPTKTLAVTDVRASAQTQIVDTLVRWQSER